MKILITGGAGFIGSHLAEKLINHKANKVIVLDNFSTGRIENIKHIRNKIKIHKIDIYKQKKDLIRILKDIDIVYHLAALAEIVPSINKPEDYFNTNVTGTFNILQACNKKKLKKFVYIASSSCYGIPKKYPTDENASINPQYPYALTKRIGEELVLHWSKVYALPAISVRLFNIYGTRSRTSSSYGAMFGIFLAQKLAGKKITVVGNGKQTRDFLYVSDLCSALIVAAKKCTNSEVYNIGSGKTYSINKIVKILKEENNVVNIPKRPGEPEITHANVNKFHKATNWKPKITIEEGIRLVLDNIEYWKNAPVWTPTKISKATKEWFDKLG